MNIESDPNHLNAKYDSAWNLLELAALATAVAGLLYFGYFQMAPWIWSQNLPLDMSDVPIWYLEEVQERDGIEMYALYVLMFLDLLFIYFLSRGWNRLAGKPARYWLALPLVVACAFVVSAGFHPPMSTFANRAVSDIFGRSFAVLIVILPIIALLYYLQQRSIYWALSAAALLLIPVCFISTAPIEWYDYSYILAPALSLFHGAGVSEIYFQYDLLLSLIGLAWMKLQLDLNAFQVVAQGAYYILLLVAFAFSRQWLLDKRLAVFVLAALVLVRIYAGPGEAVHSFQVTPLRLDLWLALLMLVYFKGPYHWSAGVFCGLMLLLHNNFGIIYSVAYVQLLLTLSVLDAVTISGKIIETASMALSTFLKKGYLNLAVILLCIVAHYLIFRNDNVPNDYYYVRLGIGFIKIKAHSFYWYVVVVSGLSFVLLLRMRSMVSSNYLATGLCLIYLAIGNSLYFFGRSHENNILNLSVVLLLLLFLLIDVAGCFLGKTSNQPTKPLMHRNLAMVVSLAFITSIIVWYGDNITGKVGTQASNAGKGQFIYPSQNSEQNIMLVVDEVKSITNGNPKVYFVGRYSFLFDYYGGYSPVGYYNPVYAWISKRDFNKFLQGLVDQGYYLVVDNGFAKEVLSPISISNYRPIQGRVVAWK